MRFLTIWKELRRNLQKSLSASYYIQVNIMMGWFLRGGFRRRCTFPRKKFTVVCGLFSIYS